MNRAANVATLLGAVALVGCMPVQKTSVGAATLDPALGAVVAAAEKIRSVLAVVGKPAPKPPLCEPLGLDSRLDQALRTSAATCRERVAAQWDYVLRRLGDGGAHYAIRDGLGSSVSADLVPDGTVQFDRDTVLATKDAVGLCLLLLLGEARTGLRTEDSTADQLAASYCALAQSAGLATDAEKPRLRALNSGLVARWTAPLPGPLRALDVAQTEGDYVPEVLVMKGQGGLQVRNAAGAVLQQWPGVTGRWVRGDLDRYARNPTVKWVLATEASTTIDVRPYPTLDAIFSFTATPRWLSEPYSDEDRERLIALWEGGRAPRLVKIGTPDAGEAPGRVCTGEASPSTHDHRRMAGPYLYPTEFFVAYDSSSGAAVAFRCFASYGERSTFGSDFTAVTMVPSGLSLPMPAGNAWRTAWAVGIAEGTGKVTLIVGRTSDAITLETAFPGAVDVALLDNPDAADRPAHPVLLAVLEPGRLTVTDFDGAVRSQLPVDRELNRLQSASLGLPNRTLLVWQENKGN